MYFVKRSGAERPRAKRHGKQCDLTAGQRGLVGDGILGIQPSYVPILMFSSSSFFFFLWDSL